MIKRMMLVWAFVWTFAGQAWAQSDIVWVQIEAQPSLMA